MNDLERKEKNESECLKKCGLKNTRRRNDVLRILDGKDSPITAEQVFIDLKEKNVPISLSTVYRILDVLVSKEIVKKISSAEADSALFELNRSIHRHYLVCLGCRKMIPVEHCPLSGLEQQMEKETGFSVTGHSLELYGYCSDCKKKMKLGKLENVKK